jgi:cob(I)alamin adenosyltransferase|tara:strand:+ start:157 stop:336 length:180 start_codon:yes stop_codon:yes gene_type:complete
MTQLDEGHDLLHAQNKDRNYQSQKVKFLEDRIATLEKSVERLHKIVGTMDRYKGESNAE